MLKVIVFDLDDTLYKEIEYLKAAYRLIAQKLWDNSWHGHYEHMLTDYYAGENVFEKVCQQRHDVEIGELMNMYRYGVYELTMDDEVQEVLSRLKDDGVLLGIVSDGRENTQMNKVKALGLTEWIDEDCIVINSDTRYFKPNPYGYDRLMSAMYEKTDKQELDFTYVGDNLTKDFICPNQKGWMTVCLKDDGRNIHKQDFASATGEALPKKVVESLTELI